MDFIAILAIFVLSIMGIFHFYWVFGGKVGLDKALPAKDGKLLLKPGKPLTFLVGVVLIFFAYIAYALQFYDFTLNENRNFYLYSGIFLSIIFILRAIGEFNVLGFSKKIKDTEFAKYDTKYFSPLCLLLGIIFAVLTYNV